MFEKLLNRCGRFLKQLIFSNSIRVNKKILDVTIKACPKLEIVDIAHQKFKNIEDFENIKPIFDKLEKFHCSLNTKNINDSDLTDLLLKNESLKSLRIACNKRIDGTFLNAVTKVTIRELILNNVRSIPLSVICCVSILFFSLLYFIKSY